MADPSNNSRDSKTWTEERNELEKDRSGNASLSILPADTYDCFRTRLISAC